MKKQNNSIESINDSIINNIIEMIKLLNNGDINGKQAKTIFEKIVTEQKKPRKLIDELGFKQITDEKVIEKHLQDIISKNKSMLDQYKERPERVEKFFIGQLMKETKGQANPVVSMKVFKKIVG
ncbi:MAG: hypothetical protein K2L48_00790 [Mycoplasmoidaceae bacterium]|nr:hypothetical protein [Mycoplasmoidaceae bacterium]